MSDAAPEPDPRLVPLAFALGVAGAFAGRLLGDHDEGWAYHLPHQALLVLPLAVGAGLVLRADLRGMRHALYAGLAGLVAGALLLRAAFSA